LALRDIDPGEELTVNYRDFYADIGKRNEIYRVGF
jgi:SET domain-containing protein